MRKGFNKGIYGSIHNEVHRQIGELKRQGLVPCQICLGKKATAYFYRECWRSYPASYLDLPIRYNYSKVSGVYVVGMSPP